MGDNSKAVDLIRSYSMAAIAYGKAIDSGNAKESDRQVQTVERAFAELKEMGRLGLTSLSKLLDSDDPGVRLWSAAHLLNYPEFGSLLVLERLKRSPSILALTAEVTLERWRDGRLSY